MLTLKVTGLVALLAVSVAGQDAVQYWIDPETVDIQTKTTWCSDQTAVCPQLCVQEEGSMETNANSCDPETLAYECECGNGNSPNMTEYSVTIPYHICQHWQENCVKGCWAGNTTCQSSCREDHPCGATNPTRVNVTSTASSTTASRTATGTSTDGDDDDEEGATPTAESGFDSSTDAADEDDAEATVTAQTSATAAKSGAMALDFGRTYGLTVVVAGLFAVFGLAM